MSKTMSGRVWSKHSSHYAHIQIHIQTYHKYFISYKKIYDTVYNIHNEIHTISFYDPVYHRRISI